MGEVLRRRRGVGRCRSSVMKRADVVSLPALRYFANEPFADLHRVEGLRGVFIATLVNGSVSEDNMRSVITFDKGGTWELLQAPAADSLGGTVDCQVEARRPEVNLRLF